MTKKLLNLSNFWDTLQLFFWCRIRLATHELKRKSSTNYTWSSSPGASFPYVVRYFCLYYMYLVWMAPSPSRVRWIKIVFYSACQMGSLLLFSPLWQSAANHKDSLALKIMRTNLFSQLHLCSLLSPFLSYEIFKKIIMIITRGSTFSSSVLNSSSSLWIKTSINTTGDMRKKRFKIVYKL